MTRSVFIERNVPYLPLPNLVEIIFTDEIAPADKTKTAFVVPVFEDGTIMLAQNLRRGAEIPGGHIEDGETIQQAARREAIEEAGCEVDHLTAIGYVRMLSIGTPPEGWKYPHPVGYQQFFTGKVTAQHPCGDYECGEPLRVSSLDEFERATVRFFGQRAREVINGS